MSHLMLIRGVYVLCTKSFHRVKTSPPPQPTQNPLTHGVYTPLCCSLPALVGCIPSVPCPPILGYFIFILRCVSTSCLSELIYCSRDVYCFHNYFYRSIKRLMSSDSQKIIFFTNVPGSRIITFESGSPVTSHLL